MDIGDDFRALQRRWFRQLMAAVAVTTLGFTVLLAGMAAVLDVRILVLGSGAVGALCAVTFVSLALGASGRPAAGAELLAVAGVAHAIAQSYLFPFAAPALAVAAVLSVTLVLPYVGGRPLRWLVASTALSSLAIASLPRMSPYRDALPAQAQQ